MKRPTSTQVVGFLFPLLIVGNILLQNPIHFRQTAQVGGLTMKVPTFWKLDKPSGYPATILLTREYPAQAGGGRVYVMDWAHHNAEDMPFTLDKARAIRVSTMENQSQSTSDQTALDLQAGSRPALCVEATVNETGRSLNCSIVGTMLQFSFSGSPNHEPAARQMLASLQ